MTLRFGHGLDYGELARAFGLREGTVRMRISCALARMRRTLEQTDPRVQIASLEAAAEAAGDFAASRGAPDPGAPPSPASRQRAPAPVAAASRTSSAPQRSAGLFGRVRSAFGGGGEPPEPPPHPLTELLREIEPSPSEGLVDGLLRRARAL